MQQEPDRRADRPSPTAARWIAAVMCISYGFAKINGAQFTVLQSELTRPMGDVSGFWLTWYYFGFSSAYGTGLALVQILSGILLVLPRTALLGALILLPLSVNIVLIDVFYGVDLSGTLAAVVLLSCVLAIIAPHRRRLWAVVALPAASHLPGRTTLLALPLLLAGACGLTWWIANHNNRVPTLIDGMWAVSAQPQTGHNRRQWQHVFFEYNRAHMAVFRSTDGTDERRHFEMDAAGVIRVWDRWLHKDTLLMVGHRASDTEIRLDLEAEYGGGRLVLHRIQPPR